MKEKKYNYVYAVINFTQKLVFQLKDIVCQRLMLNCLVLKIEL
jgi:hypothetical protein